MKIKSEWYCCIKKNILKQLKRFNKDAFLMLPKKLKNMTKKDFLQKGCFKKLHLQLTISFFPENVTFLNYMNCGHKYNVVSIIVKCYLNFRFHNQTHSLRKNLWKSSIIKTIKCFFINILFHFFWRKVYLCAMIYCISFQM